MICTCSITIIKLASRLHHPSLEAEYAWRLTQIPYCERITQQNILGFGALAGFKVLLPFRGGRLPVFSCLLLLITSNSSELVACQMPKAILTPVGLSHHLVLPLFSSYSSSPVLLQCSQKLNQRPRCPLSICVS